MFSAVYEVRGSALVRVAAGSHEFRLFEEAANNIGWSFDGLTKTVPRPATNFRSPSSFPHAVR